MNDSPSSKHSTTIGVAGLVVSLACFALFWVFTPMVFVALGFGLAAALYEGLKGSPLVACSGAAAALVPVEILALESRNAPLGWVALTLGVVVVVVAWRAARQWRVAAQLGRQVKLSSAAVFERQ